MERGERAELERRRGLVLERLQNRPTEENLWTAILAFEGCELTTARGLSFTYRVKPNRAGQPGNEIFFSRKEKGITRATVNMAFQRARELEGRVSGPKKLGTFGASYLYPVFIRLGIIHFF